MAHLPSTPRRAKFIASRKILQRGKYELRVSAHEGVHLEDGHEHGKHDQQHEHSHADD
jgi:hypothetical protein